MLTSLIWGSAAQELITMVQFKTDDIAYRKGYSYTKYDWANSYWKLGLDSYRDKTIKELGRCLRGKGYECRENISRLAVVDAIGRCQRGLMSYEGRAVDELQTFCKARGLPTKATTASGLIRALEKADDLATFPRFFDLPPEIRNVIYELHFNDFDTFTEKHAQPPLTLASRQLRLEALPLFYDCVTFGLSAVIHGYVPRRKGVRSLGFKPKYLQLDFSSFMRMPAASFVRIPKFDLHWRKSSEHIKVQVAVRFTATSELVNHNPVDLTLKDALQMGLESKFRTFKNAREMLERGGQPLTMSVSGDLFNTTYERLDKLGYRVSSGALALRTVKFD